MASIDIDIKEFMYALNGCKIFLRSLHPLVPLCGIDLPLQSVPPSSLVVYPNLSLTSKPVFSHG